MGTLAWSLLARGSPANPSQAFAFGQPSYVRMLATLLPPGPAFDNLSPDLRACLEAIAEECARLDIRGKDLINETDPRTTTELIGEWETFLGLPDDRVLVIPATLAERRLAVWQKFVSLAEGQDYTFFENLFLACGYILESINLFTDDELFRVGDRVKARCYGIVYSYTMECIYTPGAGTVLDSATLQRIIRGATHSHITVIFTED